MESDTETQDPVEHRSSEYDAFNVNRPRGILTPEERQLFKVQSPFTAQQGMQDNGVDTDAFIETVIHSLLDFHLLSVSLDDAMLEEIFYERKSPGDFKPGVPSATEAATEDVIALIYRGVDSPEGFHELLEAGIERGHNLTGERCDITIDVRENNLETAEEIAAKLDEHGTEAASILDLQILYFARVLTEDEYREIASENFM